MKKFLSLMMVSCMLLFLVACSEKTKEQSTEKTTKAITQETTAGEVPSTLEEATAEKKAGGDIKGEEETIIGPGGTVLNVKKVKDTDGNDIYVEEVTNAKGKTSYKQVVTKKDGTVKFVDVEPNDQGEFTTKPANGSQNADGGDDDWAKDSTEDFNNDSSWSDIY